MVAREYPEKVRPVVSKPDDCAAVVSNEGGSRKEESNFIEAHFALGMVANIVPGRCRREHIVVCGGDGGR